MIGIRLNFEKPSLLGPSNVGHVFENVFAGKEEDVEAKTSSTERPSPDHPNEALAMLEAGVMALGMAEVVQTLKHYEEPEPQTLPPDANTKSVSVKRVRMANISSNFFLCYGQTANMNLGDLRFEEFNNNVNPMPCELKYIIRFICRTLFATAIANYTTFFKAEMNIRKQLEEQINQAVREAVEAARRAAEEVATALIGAENVKKVEEAVAQVVDVADQQVAAADEATQGVIDGYKEAISGVQKKIDNLHMEDKIQEKIDAAGARISEGMAEAKAAMGHMFGVEAAESGNPMKAEFSTAEPAVRLSQSDASHSYHSGD